MTTANTQKVTVKGRFQNEQLADGSFYWVVSLPVGGDSRPAVHATDSFTSFAESKTALAALLCEVFRKPAGTQFADQHGYTVA